MNTLRKTKNLESDNKKQILEKYKNSIDKKLLAHNFDEGVCYITFRNFDKEYLNICFDYLVSEGFYNIQKYHGATTPIVGIIVKL